MLDKIAMNVVLKDYEIACLREELTKAKSSKHQKIQQESNERFVSLAQILAQANREPKQRLRKTAQKVIIDQSKNSSESENEQISARRLTRN